jgi:hypothetical protein
MRKGGIFLSFGQMGYYKWGIYTCKTSFKLREKSSFDYGEKERATAGERKENWTLTLIPSNP